MIAKEDEMPNPSEVSIESDEADYKAGYSAGYAWSYNSPGVCGPAGYDTLGSAYGRGWRAGYRAGEDMALALRSREQS